MKRAIVLGAGPNGLVCAVGLAAGGFDVTVVEQAATVGGAMGSADGPLPGFRHDVCAGFFPLLHASPAFEGLELELDWAVPQTVMAHPFRDGSAIALRRDVTETAASLENVAPGSGHAWTGFVEPLLARHRDLERAVLGRFPPLRASARLAWGLRLDAVGLARRALLPAAALGLELFRDQRAAVWLAGSTAHADLSPGDAGGGALAIFLKLLGHRVGWPIPRGGAQAVADALEARLVAHGGSVMCGASVEEILVARRSATGVRLAGGDTLSADAVIATTSARPFRKLLPPGTLPRGIDRRLANWRHDMGTFKVDFALGAPVPWHSAECRDAGAVHVGDTLDALFASFCAARAGRFPAEPALVLGQHSLFDSSRAPDGRHTLYAYARSPARLDIPADEAADVVEQRIEQFAPGFRALVLGRVVRDPEALELHDPALVGGDLGGGSYRLDQQLVLRPHPRLCRTRTPVRGLYLASASVHPGGGVHGAQGAGAAAAVRADLG